MVHPVLIQWVFRIADVTDKIFQFRVEINPGLKTMCYLSLGPKQLGWGREWATVGAGLRVRLCGHFCEGHCQSLEGFKGGREHLFLRKIPQACSLVNWRVEGAEGVQQAKTHCAPNHQWERRTTQKTESMNNAQIPHWASKDKCVIKQVKATEIRFEPENIQMASNYLTKYMVCKCTFSSH